MYNFFKKTAVSLEDLSLLATKSGGGESDANFRGRSSSAPFRDKDVSKCGLANESGGNTVKNTS